MLLQNVSSRSKQKHKSNRISSKHPNCQHVSMQNWTHCCLSVCSNSKTNLTNSSYVMKRK